MCEPATLTLIAAGVAAAGTVVTGVMAYQQHQYQKKVAHRNEDLATEAAKDALARGKIEEQRQYRRTSQMLGAQRAAMAANGIDVDFGSAAAVTRDTMTFGQEDAATIRENTIRETKGYEINAMNFGAEAQSQGMQATGALVSSAFSAGSTLLGGASQYGKLKAAGGGGTITSSGTLPSTF